LSRLVAPGLYFPAPEVNYRHYLVDLPKRTNSKLRNERLVASSDKVLGALEATYSSPLVSLLGRTVDSAAAGGRALERRARVWVHAVELTHPEWCPVNEHFSAPGQRRAHAGFVTPWMVGGTGTWAEDISIDCSNLVMKGEGNSGSGIYVVFTAIEVAEKRARHWVRLPWCSKMRIQEVIEVGAGGRLGDDSDVQVDPKAREAGTASSDSWKATTGPAQEAPAIGDPLCVSTVDGRSGTGKTKVMRGGVRMRAGP
jgi:hypothetical protein